MVDRKKLNILVTGSEGTLGKPLVAELERRGHSVYKCDLKHTDQERYIRCDIAEYRQLLMVFDLGVKFDYVYNLAAEFGRINGEQYYEKVWKSNVIGLRNILEIQKLKGFRLIHASSSEIYGDLDVESIREEMMPAP